MEKRLYSRRQYYEEAGFISAGRKRRHWNQIWMENEDVKKFHKDHTFRTASYDAWKDTLRGYCKVHETIWSETSKERHSLLSMQSYQGKQSALMNFWNGLCKFSWERSKTAIVYGVCYRSIASGGRGEVSVPVKVAHKTCKRCYTAVYDLDEFRTSKLCASCGNDLKLIYSDVNDRSRVMLKKKNKKVHREVRGLRCCQNPTCVHQRKTCMVDRDINACWNFWSLCRAIQRPLNFSRQQTN